LTDDNPDISEVLSENRSLDMQLLLNAKKVAGEKLSENPLDPEALEAFDRASRMIEDRAEKDKPSEDRFASRIEVFKYLKNQGYRIGRSRFYEQCPPTGGMLKIERDGTVLSSSVMNYIKRASLKRLGGQATSYDRNAEKKLTAEIEKLGESTKRIRMENLVAEGKYISAAEVEQQQAIKAGALSASFDHMFTVSTRESIRMADGNLKTAERIIRFWIDKKRELLNEFSRLKEIELEVVDDID